MPLSPLGAALPTTWWNLGLGFIWRDKHTRKHFTRDGLLLHAFFTELESDAFSVYRDTPLKSLTVTLLLSGTNLVYSANLATFRQVLGNNSAFYKPPGAIKDLQCVRQCKPILEPLFMYHPGS